MRKTRLPALLLALCLCLAPGLPRAEGLFIVDPGLPEAGRPLRIAPVTDAEARISPTMARAAAIYRQQDAAGAAVLREQALIGDLDALLALTALTRLEQQEKRPPLFGAPAAFWEEGVAQLLGGREAWYRIGIACYDASRQADLPRAALERLTADALRKAAGLGHPEAMYALAYLAETCPDAAFRLPEQPGFFIVPRDTSEYGSRTPEARYWMGAAAANGSARACFYLALACSMPKFEIDDARQTTAFCTRAMRLGLTDAALMLSAAHSPGTRQDASDGADCKAFIHYRIIHDRMRGTPATETDALAERMLKGGDARFPQACLTRGEYEEIVREAGAEFAAISTAMQERRKERDALYDAADARLATLRMAFAARAKEGTAAGQSGTAGSFGGIWFYPDHCPLPSVLNERYEFPARMPYPGDSLDKLLPKSEVLALYYHHGRDEALLLRELAQSGNINYCQLCVFLLTPAPQAAAILREQALDGNMDVFVALTALSRLREEEKQPPLFGAPAAFWEEWAVRLLGEREAWYRIAVACSKLVCCDRQVMRALVPVEEAALRKAAALGHPDAMYALALFANYRPDPAFRLPEQPGFSLPPPFPGATPECLYWLGAAAANGSAEACHAIGYLCATRSFPGYDRRKARAYYLRAARLGFPAAVAALAKKYDPLAEDGWFSPDQCKTTYQYYALFGMMAPHAAMDMNFPLPAMLEGGTDLFPRPCLNRTDYEAAYRQAEKEFAAIRMDADAKLAARAALYEQVKPRLAALRAAFAAQAKDTTAEGGTDR